MWPLQEDESGGCNGVVATTQACGCYEAQEGCGGCHSRMACGMRCLTAVHSSGCSAAGAWPRAAAERAGAAGGRLSARHTVADVCLRHRDPRSGGCAPPAAAAPAAARQDDLPRVIQHALQGQPRRWYASDGRCSFALLGEHAHSLRAGGPFKRWLWARPRTSRVEMAAVGV